MHLILCISSKAPETWQQNVWLQQNIWCIIWMSWIPETGSMRICVEFLSTKIFKSAIGLVIGMVVVVVVMVVFVVVTTSVAKVVLSTVVWVILVVSAVRIGIVFNASTVVTVINGSSVGIGTWQASISTGSPWHLPTPWLHCLYLYLLPKPELVANWHSDHSVQSVYSFPSGWTGSGWIWLDLLLLNKCLYPNWSSHLVCCVAKCFENTVGAKFDFAALVFPNF